MKKTSNANLEQQTSALTRDKDLSLLQEQYILSTHLVHAEEIAKIATGVYLIEEDHLVCSDNFYALTGHIKKEKLSLEEAVQYVHPEDFHTLFNSISRALTGENFTISFRVFHGKTKELLYLKLQAELITGEGSTNKLVGVLQDITAEKQLELELIETNYKFRHMFDHIHAGIWMKEMITDEISYVSKSLSKIYGIEIEKMKSDQQIWMESIHPEDRSVALQSQHALNKGQVVENRYRLQDKNGAIKWIFDQRVPWFNEQGELQRLFGVVVDISHEMKLQQEVAFYATHDTLTDLPNHRSLNEKLELLISADHPFTLYYLDIDRFSFINETLGYPAGDQALCQIAARLSKFGDPNLFIARLASNDFVIIEQGDVSEMKLEKRATELIKLFKKEFNISEYVFRLTTSIGISIFPDNGRKVNDLLENAHRALHEAKSRGKNMFFIDRLYKGKASNKKKDLEKDIFSAIENKQFEIYYQPKVATKTGRMVSSEALIRWNHPKWGIVMPGDFIPLAEESHFIDEIGDWVIKSVINQLRIWKEEELTLHPVSINISSTRFLKPGLVFLVEQLLQKEDVKANLIEFEITENSLLKNDSHVMQIFSDLQKLGVSIAIDDFGTGYSSLQYLMDFQADVIKIDQLFIQNIEKPKCKEKAIISGILHIARALNDRVVAEGVETAAQYTFLKEEKCDFLQGYLFSKPLPEHAFKTFLKRTNFF